MRSHPVHPVRTSYAVLYMSNIAGRQNPASLVALRESINGLMGGVKLGLVAPRERARSPAGCLKMWVAFMHSNRHQQSGSACGLVTFLTHMSSEMKPN